MGTNGDSDSLGDKYYKVVVAGRAEGDRAIIGYAKGCPTQIKEFFSERDRSVILRELTIIEVTSELLEKKKTMEKERADLGSRLNKIDTDLAQMMEGRE